MLYRWNWLLSASSDLLHEQTRKGLYRTTLGSPCSKLCLVKCWNGWSYLCSKHAHIIEVILYIICSVLVSTHIICVFALCKIIYYRPITIHSMSQIVSLPPDQDLRECGPAVVYKYCVRDNRFAQSCQSCNHACPRRIYGSWQKGWDRVFLRQMLPLSCRMGAALHISHFGVLLFKAVWDHSVCHQPYGWDTSCPCSK